MIRQLVAIPEKEFPIPAWLKSVEHPNLLPTPWTEVTEHDWYHFDGLECCRYEEFRQVFLAGLYQGLLLPVTIRWYHSCAWAISKPRHWRCGQPDESRIVFADRPRYFRIGCRHEYDETYARMCYRELRCRHCGHTTSVDSSD